MDDKKLQAAIAGVYYYLKLEEEEKICSPVAPASLSPYPSPWAMSGRESIMRWRTLVQSRVLRK